MFSPRFARLWIVGLVVTMLAGSPALAGDDAASKETTGAANPYYEKVLREKLIEPTAVGLRKYLRGLHPGEAQRKRARQLIGQLGSTDSFAAREEAMAQLLVLPVLPSEALIAASNGPDPEIRWRAKKILQLGKPESARVLYAAFRIIEQKRLKVTAELLRAIPLCDKDHLKLAGRRALVAAADRQDAELLRQAIKGRNLEVRVAATAALGKALGKEAADELRPLLADSQDRMKLAAARAMADFGDRRSLPVLGAMLSSNDLQVRVQASATLRYLSGKHFGFAAYDTEERRAAAREKWKRWIDGEGRTAKLKFPLKNMSLELGRTLVCTGNNKVLEFDAQGRKTWEVSLQNPWGCYGLPDGRRFIACHSARTVIEFDATGKRLREYKLPGNPYDVQVLETGNFLIPSHNTSEAFEMRPDGKVVWRNKAGRPVGAQRLENGNTLLCLHNQGKVIEVDPDGKEIWSLRGVPQPYTAQRLENGNTLVLITGTQTVAEYDPSGKVVWSRKGVQGYDAQRLPNGNTLVVQQGVREIDPDGKTVWQTPNMFVSRFCRY